MATSAKRDPADGAASPLPRRPAAVVFDMDGVLIDTETIYRDAIVAAGAAQGVSVPAAVYLGIVGMPSAASRLYVAERLPGIDIDRLWDDARRRFQAAADRGVALKPGVVGVLDRLDALGLPRAVATSSRRATVEHHLGHQHGLLGRFSAIVAREDYAAGKPAPDPFLAAAAALGVAPAACLALEDSRNGIRSAAAAGLMTVMVPDLIAPDAADRALLVAVARDLDEVAGWLA
jgi:HAD superfamily hydrolase (TIGR01509 family)